MYDDVEIPYPETFGDDLAGRAEVVQAVRMRMMDLDPIIDLKAAVPPGLSLDEEIDWRYQRYIKDYLRVVASIDDNVGRMLDWLDDAGLADDTIVVYTPGAHGPPSAEEWELFDLEADRFEVDNLHGRPGTDALEAALRAELARLQMAVGDLPHERR